MRDLRERSIKRYLVKQMRESNRIEISEVVEWLWEDFGIRCRPSWREVERKIAKSDEISANDVAVFMMERGVMPEEEIWFEGDV